MKSKLEKDNVLKFLIQHDIVSISEIKTPLRVSLPGYVSFCSRDPCAPSRGGVCVFVKEHLRPAVMTVDTATPDQVWITLSCAVGVLFGFLYIPPRDSPYFTENSFSTIQEKMKSNGDKRFIFNRRYEHEIWKEYPKFT